MRNLMQVALSLIALLVVASASSAGVGLDYGGEGSGTDSQFNFAVSSCSGVGMLTTETMNGGTHQPRMSSRDVPGLDVLQLFQRTELGNMMGGGGGGRGSGVDSNGLGMGLMSLGSFGNVQAAFLPVIIASLETTDGGTGINSGYCWCPPNMDGGTGGSGGPDNHGDDGGAGGGGSEGNGGDGGTGSETPDGGGGDPNPSVVPEPGSFALWTVFGALLVSVIRRR